MSENVTEKDAYRISFGRSVWCALFGHDAYRVKGWYFSEWGCHRCKLRFLHQWDLFDTSPLVKEER